MMTTQEPKMIEATLATLSHLDVEVVGRDESGTSYRELSGAQRLFYYRADGDKLFLVLGE